MRTWWAILQLRVGQRAQSLSQGAAQLSVLLTHPSMTELQLGGPTRNAQYPSPYSCTPYTREGAQLAP